MRVSAADRRGPRLLRRAGSGRSRRRARARSRSTSALSIERNYKPLVLALRALPMPVVCAVNGVAAGAGANIALACDIVVAARSASFIQAFCKIGLIPDAGGTYFLPRLVGTARAMGLAMLGDKLLGAAGGRLGPDLEVRRRCGIRADASTRCCSNSRRRRRAALAATKRAI